MALHEWPLILFTVLAQASVGAFLLLGFNVLSKKLTADESRGLHKAMFVIWPVLGLGFLASVMHLGSPMRALNSLGQLGSSWLSNEIFGGSLFFALGGVYWLLSVLNKSPVSARNWLLALAMLAGVGFMYAMSQVYMLPTVPTWNTGYTPLSFVLTAVIVGLAFGRLLLPATVATRQSRALSWLISAAVLVSVLATISQLAGLSSIQSAIVSAEQLLPQLGCWQSGRVLLLLCAALISLVPAIRREQAGRLRLSLVLLMVLCAELIGRTLFFSLYMSSGV